MEIRVYIFLPSSFFFLKREWWDKSYTRTWGKYKIRRWYNHSSRPRVLFGFGTCDNPTQWRDLGSILCQREYSCLACYFQVTVKVENVTPIFDYLIIWFIWEVDIYLLIYYAMLNEDLIWFYATWWLILLFNKIRFENKIKYLVVG